MGVHMHTYTPHVYNYINVLLRQAPIQVPLLGAGLCRSASEPALGFAAEQDVSRRRHKSVQFAGILHLAYRLSSTGKRFCKMTCIW